jgi:hypothetical protein
MRFLRAVAGYRLPDRAVAQPDKATRIKHALLTFAIKEYQHTRHEHVIRMRKHLFTNPVEEVRNDHGKDGTNNV